MVDDDPATFYKVLSYLYERDYDDKDPKDETAEHNNSEANEKPTKLKSLKSVAAKLKGKPKNKPVSDVDQNPNWADLSDSSHTRLVNNAWVYAMADKYDIQKLKELAARKFQAVVFDWWTPGAMADVAREVYETTPATDRTLRDLVINQAVNQTRALYTEPSWKDVIESHGDLSIDLIRGMARSNLRMEETIDGVMLDNTRHGVATEAARSEAARAIETGQKATTDLKRAREERVLENDELSNRISILVKIVDRAFWLMQVHKCKRGFRVERAQPTDRQDCPLWEQRIRLECRSCRSSFYVN